MQSTYYSDGNVRERSTQGELGDDASRDAFEKETKEKL